MKLQISSLVLLACAVAAERLLEANLAPCVELCDATEGCNECVAVFNRSAAEASLADAYAAGELKECQDYHDAAQAGFTEDSGCDQTDPEQGLYDVFDCIIDAQAVDAGGEAPCGAVTAAPSAAPSVTPTAAPVAADGGDN